MKIINGTIYTPAYQFQKGCLDIQGAVIKEITMNPSISNEEAFYDAKDCYVIPGLIDLHFHGCVGKDFCDGTPESLETIARYEATQGITGICPASMTFSEDTLTHIMTNARQYYALHSSPESKSLQTDCADLLGINLEGPFLSEAKKGAQNAAFLHKPDVVLFERLQAASGNLIRIADIAPEMDENFHFIKEVSKNCTVSLAHTAADYALCMKAFEAGASHVTHLFNAMNGFTHREPGLPGAAFDTPKCHVELICDGIHIAPSAIRMAFALYGAERIVLISDSMMATGMPDGSYSLGGQPVTVQGTLATLSDGTIAGSATNLMDCVRKAVFFGVPLESAIRCATANPAKVIKASSYGSLAAGFVANVVILNPDLTIRDVFLHGQKLPTHRKDKIHES